LERGTGVHFLREPLLSLLVIKLKEYITIQIVSKQEDRTKWTGSCDSTNPSISSIESWSRCAAVRASENAARVGDPTVSATGVLK